MIGKGVCVLDYSLSTRLTLPGKMKFSDRFWPKLKHFYGCYDVA